MGNTELNQVSETTVETADNKKKEKRILSFHDKMLLAIVIELAVIALLLCVGLICYIFSDDSDDEIVFAEPYMNEQGVIVDGYADHGPNDFFLEEMAEDEDIDDMDDDDIEAMEDIDDDDIDDMDDEDIDDVYFDDIDADDIDSEDMEGDVSAQCGVQFSQTFVSNGEINAPESACVGDEQSTCVSPYQNQKGCGCR